MAKLYIHCGFHKTGTTSVQRALAAHEQALKAAGFLYPTAGRVGPATGQHNIAWELARDRRFEARWGNLSALADELATFSGDAILSCEDLEGIMPSTERWTPLVRMADRLGRELVLVIYLRSQVSYLESLYYQCLRAGLGEEYVDYAAEVVDLGQVKRKEWVFHFDYLRILDSAAQIPGARLCVVNYHDAEGGSVVTDFFSRIGIPPEILQPDVASLRKNGREAPAAALERFFRNRVERELAPPEAQASEQLADLLPVSVVALAATRERIAARFHQSNREVCARWGLSAAGFLEEGCDGRPGASLERVFSFETQLNIQYVASALAADDHADARRQAQAWAQWVSA